MTNPDPHAPLRRVVAHDDLVTAEVVDHVANLEQIVDRLTDALTEIRGAIADAHAAGIAYRELVDDPYRVLRPDGRRRRLDARADAVGSIVALVDTLDTTGLDPDDLAALGIVVADDVSVVKV